MFTGIIFRIKTQRVEHTIVGENKREIHKLFKQWIKRLSLSEDAFDYYVTAD